ncbi:MAG TPA: 3-dehydroquinate synthase [Gammaproteobacteria bacterium]|nr:3-dehydroquinate synthase [Gammaproteobacteria bacterium]
MDTLQVALGARSYPIHIGPGLLGDAPLLARSVAAEQVMLVTDTTVGPLYAARLLDAIAAPTKVTHVLPDGEHHKTLGSFAAIIDALIEAGLHRDACIVALGGGVVGDVAGFAAACYQRGIDYVQVPTTLLAQVDSSVGGKTAVNHPRAKNMIGAFYQPTAVIADTDTLGTLPPRQFAAGVAEVIKYGLIFDAKFFAWLETHIDEILGHDPAALRFIVRRSCELKAGIVAEDEREHGRRALLNLGHTFGHAIESLGNFDRWLHGEAVAIGMMLALRTSIATGRLEAGADERLERLLERAHLPTRAPGLDADRVLELMHLDKKTSTRGLSLILLDDIGAGVVAPAPAPEVLRSVLRPELRE